MTPEEQDLHYDFSQYLSPEEPLLAWAWGVERGVNRRAIDGIAGALGSVLLGFDAGDLPTSVGHCGIAVTAWRLLAAQSTSRREHGRLRLVFHNHIAFMRGYHGACGLRRTTTLGQPVVELKLPHTQPPLDLAFAKYSWFPNNLQHVERIAHELGAQLIA